MRVLAPSQLLPDRPRVAVPAKLSAKPGKTPECDGIPGYRWDTGSGATALLRLGEKACYGLPQDRQIAINDLQDPFDADPEVLVRNQVTQSRDIAPGHLGRLGTSLLGEMFDGLADDPKLEEQRVVEHRIVGGALLASACRMSEDRLNGALKIS
jgi:hypothetical protein